MLHSKPVCSKEELIKLLPHFSAYFDGDNNLKFKNPILDSGIIGFNTENGKYEETFKTSITCIPPRPHYPHTNLSVYADHYPIKYDIDDIIENKQVVDWIKLESKAMELRDNGCIDDLFDDSCIALHNGKYIEWDNGRFYDQHNTPNFAPVVSENWIAIASGLNNYLPYISTNEFYDIFKNKLFDSEEHMKILCYDHREIDVNLRTIANQYYNDEKVMYNRIRNKDKDRKHYKMYISEYIDAIDHNILFVLELEDDDNYKYVIKFDNKYFLRNKILKDEDSEECNDIEYPNYAEIYDLIDVEKAAYIPEDMIEIPDILK